MNIRGNKAYLTIYQQMVSGYSSPIDLDTFDLNAERVAADTEIDRLEALQATDDNESGDEKRNLIPDLERAQVRSTIARGIGQELAQRNLVVQFVSDAENFLRETDSN